MELEQTVEQFVMSLPCRDHSPFPEAEVAPNKAYARLLLDAMGGGGAAEFTAIAQYINHHFTARDEEVAELELCIALVEMQHLEILGDLIVELGGEPRYWRGNHGYWQGHEVAYAMSDKQMLQQDIFSEEAAIAAYEMLLAQIDEPKIQAIIRRIIRDEQVHLRLFMEALARVGG